MLRFLGTAFTGLAATVLLAAPAQAAAGDRQAAIRDKQAVVGDNPAVVRDKAPCGTADPALAFGTPQVARAGERIYSFNTGLFLIDPEGYRRGMPSTIYGQLFQHPGKAALDPLAGSIPEGPPLSTDAYLAKAGGGTVYLVSNECKRPVDPAAGTKYDFNLDNAVPVTDATLETIPSGPTWK